MSHIIYKSLIATTLISISVGSIAAPLSLKMHLATPEGFGVTSTLIEGDKEAILVNAQFNRSEALRVAADILDSGKTLKTIFISYGDPDYYFGLDTLKTFFPDVEVIAPPEVVKHIQATQQGKLAYWGPQMGVNAPAKTIIPTAYTPKKLTLEGQDIEIRGQDSTVFLWIPSIKAVVGGNLVSSGIHVWTADYATKQAQDTLIQGLEVIKALHPDIVIPAHTIPNAPVGIAAVDFTQSYLKAYQKAASASKNSTELVEKMKAQYPELQGADSLELGAKVVKGEMQWQ